MSRNRASLYGFQFRVIVYHVRSAASDHFCRVRENFFIAFQAPDPSYGESNCLSRATSITEWRRPYCSTTCTTVPELVLKMESPKYTALIVCFFAFNMAVV